MSGEDISYKESITKRVKQQVLFNIFFPNLGLITIIIVAVVLYYIFS